MPLARACHGLALLNFVVFLDVLFLGGFRFEVTGLTVSATHLRNPFLMTLGFTLLGKLFKPALALWDSPLGKIAQWMIRKLHDLKAREVSPLIFWISVVFLNSMLFLPPMLTEMDKSTFIPLPPLHAPRGWYDTLLFFLRRDTHDLFRISGELLTIATLVAVTRRIPVKKWLLKLGLGLYLALLVYQTYESMSLRIFGERPLLYSDLLLVREAAYLVVDLWSPRLLDTTVRMIVWTLMTVGAIALAYRFVTHRLQRLSPSSPTAILGMVAWPVVLFSTFWYNTHDSRTTVRWITPNIAKNVSESFEGIRSFGLSEKDKPLPYAENWSVRLNGKPNLFLILIESYGKVLANDPGLKDAYSRKMAEVEARLTDHGWHAVTNFSEAPISGGKSWLSMGTVMTGIRVENQALYSLLLRTFPDYPHLVRYLKSQDYTTLTLQPAMRPRAGFSFDQYETFYGYDLRIYQNDLEYEGDFYGWGMIPDQYSLNLAHERFITSTPKPFFLSFITVSSHSPWYDLPPYIDDWKRLGEPGFHADEHAPYASLEDHWPRTWKKLSYHLKKQLGLKDVFRLEDYLAHMNYQMDVITDYIVEKAPNNSVFILLGDHQPPVISNESQDFATPVHVISRDKELVQSLQGYGFVPGTSKEPSLGGSIRHEVIYSILVRVLAENYGEKTAATMPPHRPRGVSLSTLRR